MNHYFDIRQKIKSCCRNDRLYRFHYITKTADKNEQIRISSFRPEKAPCRSRHGASFYRKLMITPPMKMRTTIRAKSPNPCGSFILILFLPFFFQTALQQKPVNCASGKIAEHVRRICDRAVFPQRCGEFPHESGPCRSSEKRSQPSYLSACRQEQQICI